MKALIPMTDCGIFVSKKDEEVRVSSLYVAKTFDKRHVDILRVIDGLVAEDSGLSKEFSRRNFAPTSYIDSFNRKQRCYELTRTGFTMVVMSFTGKKANAFKEWYITKFEEMAEQLKHVQRCRLDCPELTEALKELNSNNKYIYAIEFDMLNKIVLGMTAREFRKVLNIPKSDSIRPYMNDIQIELMEQLQKYDANLVELVPDYATRKALCEKKHQKLLDKLNQ